jgi:outer membrane lipoprotein-sorting protein
LENMRPQSIYEALLIPAVDPKNEIAVMQSDYEQVLDSKRRPVLQPDYEVIVVRTEDHHNAYLSRKIIFSRTDLLPHHQLIYDQNGNLQTDTQYEGYKDYNGVKFPTQIEIKRPQEEYDITLTIIKLELNQSLPDDKFALEQPSGADVVNLNQPHAQISTQPKKDQKD